MKKQETTTPTQETTTPTQETTTQAQEVVSPFTEVKAMNHISAVNVLIQAANAAQGAGVLSVRDSVLLAGAAEFLTNAQDANKKS